jgi:hypothetical protein
MQTAARLEFSPTLSEDVRTPSQRAPQLLQGLRKPVNDLSRGALVDDIVYPIALTAIQAEQSFKATTSDRCKIVS